MVGTEGRAVRFGRKRFDWTISSGSLELVKWIAIFAMTVDHINTGILYRIGAANAELFMFGRIAAPLFAFMVAYNLARPTTEGSSRKPRIQRMLKLLLVFGLLAIAPHYYMGQPVFTPNIMFTFFIAASLIWLIESIRGLGWASYIKAPLYFSVFLLHILFGGVAEFGYPLTGLIVTLFLAYTCSSPTAKAFWGFTALLSLNALQLVNETHAALAALPVVLLAMLVNVENLKRSPRLLFYIYYPAHLALFALFGFALAA